MDNYYYYKYRGYKYKYQKSLEIDGSKPKNNLSSYYKRKYHGGAKTTPLILNNAVNLFFYDKISCWSNGQLGNRKILLLGDIHAIHDNYQGGISIDEYIISLMAQGHCIDYFIEEEPFKYNIFIEGSEPILDPVDTTTEYDHENNVTSSREYWKRRLYHSDGTYHQNDRLRMHYWDVRLDSNKEKETGDKYSGYNDIWFKEIHQLNRVLETHQDKLERDLLLEGIIINKDFKEREEYIAWLDASRIAGDLNDVPLPIEILINFVCGEDLDPKHSKILSKFYNKTIKPIGKDTLDEYLENTRSIHPYIARHINNMAISISKNGWTDRERSHNIHRIKMIFGQVWYGMFRDKILSDRTDDRQDAWRLLPQITTDLYLLTSIFSTSCMSGTCHDTIPGNNIIVYGGVRHIILIKNVLDSLFNIQPKVQCGYGVEPCLPKRVTEYNLKFPKQIGTPELF